MEVMGDVEKLAQYAAIKDDTVMNITVFNAPPEDGVAEAIGCEVLAPCGDVPVVIGDTYDQGGGVFYAPDGTAREPEPETQRPASLDDRVGRIEEELLDSYEAQAQLFEHTLALETKLEERELATMEAVAELFELVIGGE